MTIGTRLNCDNSIDGEILFHSRINDQPNNGHHEHDAFAGVLGCIPAFQAIDPSSYPRGGKRRFFKRLF